MPWLAFALGQTGPGGSQCASIPASGQGTDGRVTPSGRSGSMEVTNGPTHRLLSGSEPSPAKNMDLSKWTDTREASPGCQEEC